MNYIKLNIRATIVGSRDTPDVAQDRLTTFARAVQDNGGVGISGGAPGADQACENGITDPYSKEIFLPFSNFNGVKNGVGVYVLDQLHSRHQEAAREIASRFHPNWTAVENKGQATVKLMTRNVFQNLGTELKTPSDLVVMWAKGTRNCVVNKDSRNRIFDVPGGTGLAVRLAHHLEIPILHIGLPEHQEILQAYQDKDAEAFYRLLWEEGQWDRQATINAVAQLRQSVGLDAPPATQVVNRWKRTSYRP